MSNKLKKNSAKKTENQQQDKEFSVKKNIWKNRILLIVGAVVLLGLSILTSGVNITAEMSNKFRQVINVVVPTKEPDSGYFAPAATEDPNEKNMDESKETESPSPAPTETTFQQ